MSADRFILYIITNRVNQKRYVGITSKSMAKRWSDHISQAFCPKVANGSLQKAIAKYGREKFTVEHFASALSYESLRLLEIAVIAQEGTYYGLGYGFPLARRQYRQQGWLWLASRKHQST